MNCVLLLVGEKKFCYLVSSSSANKKPAFLNNVAEIFFFAHHVVDTKYSVLAVCILPRVEGPFTAVRVYM